MSYAYSLVSRLKLAVQTSYSGIAQVDLLSTVYAFQLLGAGELCIGGGTKFGYGGMAVVIHSRAVVGKNCMIGTCVTIGGKSGWYEVPVIGDNVHICSGAKIIGPVRIGNNVIVGANAVVDKDVPDNCIVAGVPAKIIRENIRLENYEGPEAKKYRGDNGWPMMPKRQ